MTIYNWLLICCWVVFIAYWIFSASDTKKNVKSYALRGTLYRIAIAVLAAIVLRVPLGGIFGEALSTGSISYALGMMSVTLAALGIGFAIYARRYLGRNWGMPRTVKENPELVASGPYAYIRHPIYTGVIVALLGSTIIGGWPWILAFVAAAGYFIYSAYQEEKVLLAEFPDTYPAYKARTKMLVPYVF